MSSLSPSGWEARLLSRAGEARLRWGARPAATGCAASARLLRAGYEDCRAITAQHSRSFYIATRLLPAEKRRAMRVLYAICRLTDDLVDQPAGAAEAALEMWRKQVLAPGLSRHGPLLTAWDDVRLRYGIPACYVEQLFDGVALDLRRPCLETFDDLAAYAYGVASTVGLMSMCIIGTCGSEAVPYAIKLGVALQLTNILRDVADDLRAGRVYLPAADLGRFGLGRADLAAGRVDERWRAFMRFQIERNRRLYAEAWPGIRLLNSDSRLAVTAAADLYRAILADIEAHDYDVFSRRAHVPLARMLRRLPGIWWQSRQ